MKVTSDLRGRFVIVAIFVSLFSQLVQAEQQERTHRRTERMAAWHDTLVAVDEVVPNSTVLTYVKDRTTHTERYQLSKIIPFLTVDGKLVGPSKASFIAVDDIPGYVNASYVVDGVTVEFQLVPLMIGRDTEGQEGVALYRIKTTPATPLAIHCGSGQTYSHPLPRQFHRQEDFSGIDSNISIDNGTAYMTNETHPHTAAINSTGTMAIETGQDNAKYLSVNFENGSGDILISYGSDPVAAKKTIKVNADAEFEALKTYYEKLLSSKIETPEKVIDQAFNSAIYNLEYNWLQPLGWMECIHHWVAMFHMQHTAAAEWLDQTDRSRMCTLSQAYRLHPSGAAPDMYPGGQVFHAFGGTNQYFAYQISRYWDFTADEAFIKEIAPYFDKVLAQTYKEYDPDNDFLLRWKSQIGQQEDYLHHPFNSTSPSIESINMMRTRRKIARHFGDEELARRLTSQINETKTTLVNELWDPVLGRFLYYKDPQGKVHLDAQYESYTYPIIYDIVDQFDAYTNLRHLRDRLTGRYGEVYCSNNFPNHINGTWGMQAGAAQQPVATWALGKMGLRNEAYQPLKAIAAWVMNDDLRGSWPEISLEETPAYFSPPAGVYIQIVIESIFGLQMDKPNETLKITPSFPDDWPKAKLNLPHFQADFRRRGNKLYYDVNTDDKLARQVRWLLQPSEIKSVRVNGKKVKFSTSPAIGCVELTFETPPAKSTQIVIDTKPINYNIDFETVIAQGQPFELSAKGCDIVRVEDRSGILTSDLMLSDKKLTASIGKYLLRDYDGYGRLGQMNFARRTFFVLCGAAKGVQFWNPVDLTVLTEYEAAQQGDMVLTDTGATVNLLIRNNTKKSLSGRAYLDVARGVAAFNVSVPAMSEKTFAVEIPSNRLALLSPGDNSAKLVLPSGDALAVKLVATNIFETTPALKKYIANCFEQIELPKESMVPDTGWKGFRKYRAFHHPPWVWNSPALEAVTTETLEAPELPVEFKISGRNMVPVSYTLGSNDYTVQLDDKTYRKLYLLIVPFLDSHDMFAPAGRITLMRDDGELIGARTLYFPGDLDWFCPIEKLDVFCTARIKRDDRYGLLPMLTRNDTDWDLARPAPSGWHEKTGINNFPQPVFWATCIPLHTKTSVMSIVEVNLRKPTNLKSLTISTIGTEPAFGMVAITAEIDGTMDALKETKYLPGIKHRNSANSIDVDSLKEWKLEGDAFDIAPVPPLFEEPTLNSRAKAGEAATGKACSPDILLEENINTLFLNIQGGDNLNHDQPGKLYVDIIDSATSERLNRHYVHGNHQPRWVNIAVDKWIGKTIHVALVDESTESAYAWIGITGIMLK